MKLKITQRKITEKETDIDLPIYLYTQDEACNDTYIKWDGKEQTIVEQSWYGFKVERYFTDLHIEEYQLKNLTTRNQFEGVFKEAVEYLSS